MWGDDGGVETWGAGRGGRRAWLTIFVIVASSCRYGKLPSIAASYCESSSFVASAHDALTGFDAIRTRAFSQLAHASASAIATARFGSSPCASYRQSPGSFSAHNSSKTAQRGSTAGVPHASASSTVRPYLSGAGRGRRG